jgi:hypothetical protein
MRGIRLRAAATALGAACIVLGVASTAGAVTAGGGDTVHSRTAALAPPVKGTFTLSNGNSSLCLGITGGKDDADAVQEDCNNAVDQIWNAGSEYGKTGYYRLINWDGECLGVRNGGKAATARVTGWQCDATKQYYWKWVSSAGGEYHLVNYNSGMALGVLNNSRSVGAAVVQVPEQGASGSQQWEPIPSLAYESTIQASQYWAGVSAYPNNGDVTDVEASWKVPKVSCAAGSYARAAVWVGLWGGLTSIDDKTAWLPQIGTDSQCINGKAYYLLVWEMESQVAGGGNAAQDGYECDSYYCVTGNLPTEKDPFGGSAQVAFLHPGDSVSASVLNEDSSGSGAASRTFYISFSDNKTNHYAAGTMKTNRTVPLADITRQAGVIAESNTGPYDLFGIPIPIPKFYGLAQFAPLSIGPVYVYGGSGGDSFYRWPMQHGSEQLATPSFPGILNYTQNFVYNYSLKWQHTGAA